MKGKKKTPTQNETDSRKVLLSMPWSKNSCRGAQITNHLGNRREVERVATGWSVEQPVREVARCGVMLWFGCGEMDQALIVDIGRGGEKKKRTVGFDCARRCTSRSSKGGRRGCGCGGRKVWMFWAQGMVGGEGNK